MTVPRGPAPSPAPLFRSGSRHSLRVSASGGRTRRIGKPKAQLRLCDGAGRDGLEPDQGHDPGQQVTGDHRPEDPHPRPGRAKIQAAPGAAKTEASPLAVYTMP